MTTTVVIQQPTGTTNKALMVTGIEGHRNWSTGLLDCFDDFSSCLMGFFCLPCTVCTVASRTGECCCMPYCVPGGTVVMRTRIRTIGGIQVLTDAWACVDMEKTVATVQECPDTEEKWNARALLKKCNTVCSTSEYHCVINKEMTAYIEVCATPRYMQDKEKLAEMSRQIEILKTQSEMDNQELKKKVLEKNEECKRLNNKLQEAKGNIRVLCRIKLCEENDILSTTKTTVSIKGTEKRYTFERVFDKESTQREVYEDIKELVRSFLDGYNLCIFAYGQTGSGKTYTMEGPPDNISEDTEGIIPRAMKQVFQTIKELKVAGWTYKLRASYIELYNEEIRDLTKGSNVQEKHEIKYPRGEQGKATITNIKEEEVENTDDALNFYKQASKSRTSGKTGRNERSSRSHAIFRVEMTGRVENVEGVKNTCSGTLTLVDLAGSEKLDDAASVTTNQETKKINLSLMELSKVLRALRKKENPIYRNSKLTFLLKNSLGGNSKTLMIVNVSPTEDCKRETERTLEFGKEVSKVVLENVPRKNK
uniref:Kinesin-like protein n=1 Tax=Crassostrea virginica TaxID=6565 RepID=A0A8B8AT24_CRAVI|nr:protein claret segregational-like isoform X3 [Crassostrea virginica]